MDNLRSAVDQICKIAKKTLAYSSAASNIIRKQLSMGDCATAAAAEPDTHLERELELPDGRTLYVADNLALADEAGATTWDCGLVLAHYLIKQAELGKCLVAGQRVIELGSGTGIVGLTAAALGAQAVTLTDKQQILPLLQRNIQRNGLQDSTQAVTLDWGQPLPNSMSPPYDILLCSDLVYSTASVQPLLRTITALSGPDSLVLYACEFREGAGLENFYQSCSLPQFGLDPQLLPYMDLHEEWCSPDILVWHIKKAAAAAAPSNKEQQQQLQEKQEKREQAQQEKQELHQQEHG